MTTSSTIRENDEEDHRRIVIVDLEATCCDQDSVPRSEREIIEIGAIHAQSPADPSAPGDLEIVGEFQSFVKPVRHPVLSAFCMGLTGIQQEHLNAAPEFAEANAAFADWLTTQKAVAWGSWGFFDLRQYRNDCRFHEVTNPLPARYRNIKEDFMKHHRQPRSVGVADALEQLRLSFEGRQHRAINDARHIARIAARLPD